MPSVARRPIPEGRPEVKDRLVIRATSGYDRTRTVCVPKTTNTATPTVRKSESEQGATRRILTTRSEHIRDNSLRAQDRHCAEPTHKDQQQADDSRNLTHTKATTRNPENMKSRPISCLSSPRLASLELLRLLRPRQLRERQIKMYTDARDQSCCAAYATYLRYRTAETHFQGSN